MKKIISFILAFTIFLNAPLLDSFAFERKNIVNTNNNSLKYSIEKPTQNDDNNFIHSVGALSKKLVANKSETLAFLKSKKDKLGISSVINQLKFESLTKDDAGHTIVKYFQVVDGIPVDGSKLTVNYDKNGIIKSVSGNVDKDTTLTSLGKVNISKEKAIQIAKDQFSFDSLRHEAVANEQIIELNNKNYKVYKINITYTSPKIANYNVYVEETSGKVIKIDNLIMDVAATGSGIDVSGATKALNLSYVGSTYKMENTASLAGTTINTYDMQHLTRDGVIVSNPTNYFSSENTKAAVSAHYNAEKVIGFYKNLFNRNSLDGKQMVVNSYVHYDSNYNNAFWDGEEIVFGDGDKSEFTYLSGDLGIVGHELTHGVITYTADLDYSNQSGALNESFADVFGVLIKTYEKYNVENGGTWEFNPDDWLIGEAVYTPNKQGDALRSLANPRLYEQPENMSEYRDMANTWYTDNGGVHINSGIPNKAAFLVAQSIGLRKTADVYYRALANYMTKFTDFVDAKRCIVQAATDLYGASSAEVSAIKTAFHTVGIGVTPENDTFETNDEIDQAYGVTLGETYSSYISTKTDVDFYKISLPTNGTVTVTLSNLPADYDLYLLNANGTTITSSRLSNTLTENITYTLAAGTYYIKVNSYLGSFSTIGAYNLSTTFASTGSMIDNFEPNDLISGAYPITLGDSYQSYISTATDEDMYKIKLSMSGTIVINLSNLKSDYDLCLTDSTGKIISTSRQLGIINESITSTLSAGTYYIKVNSFSGCYSTSDAYTLSTSFSVVDTFEPNDMVSDAYQITAGESYQSYISSATDVDFYKINISSVCTLNVSLLGLPKDYDLYLIDSNGNTLSGSSHPGISNENITYRTVAGSYYLKVVGYLGNFNNLSPYTILTSVGVSDTFEPNDEIDSAYEITLGDSYQSYVFSETDVDFYKVTIPLDGTLMADLSNLPGDFDLTLLDCNGTTLSSSKNSGTSSEKITYALTAGIYYLKVKGYLNSYSSLSPYNIETTFKQYTLNFASNGGSYIASQMGNMNTLIDKPLIPTKTGYSFVGWYTFEGLPVTFPYNLTSNVTLYAHWSPNEYSVTYNANGGTWASAKDRAIYNTTYKIPATTPKKAGYTFTGWNASGSVTGAYSAGSGFTMGAGKVTLTAGWKINSYTVIFNANGKAFASKTAVYNTIIIASSNPSKPKYSFKGWYTSASGGTKITFPYKVTNNINLYAQWTLFTSTVVNNPKVQIGSKNSAVVKWNSIAGATGYQIYRATFSSGAYSLIATVSNVNFTNYSLIKNKTYYYRVRAYQTNGTSKVYSGYSKVVSIKL